MFLFSGKKNLTIIASLLGTHPPFPPPPPPPHLFKPFLSLSLFYHLASPSLSLLSSLLGFLFGRRVCKSPRGSSSSSSPPFLALALSPSFLSLSAVAVYSFLPRLRPSPWERATHPLLLSLWTVGKEEEEVFVLRRRKAAAEETHDCSFPPPSTSAFTIQLSSSLLSRVGRRISRGGKGRKRRM